MESLESIFKGKEAPVVEQPKAEAPVEVKAETPAQETEQQRADRERDERGRFKAKEQEAQTPAKPEAPKAPEAPKVETKPAPTAAEKAKPATTTEEAPPHVPVKALQEERRKRQELERQLAALQQPKKLPDVTTDPQGFQQHLNETLQSREVDMRVNLSAAFARKQYQDFDSVMESWFQMTEANPYLYQQAIQQELPADWAYNHVKQQLLLKEIGDPAAWREAEKARLRAELEAEIAQRQPPQRPAAPVPPPSLANAQSAVGGISTAPAYEGPTPLKSILRR